MPEATAELPVDTSATAADMAQELFGSGVTVTGAAYFGDASSSGTYTDGEAIAPGVTPGDTGVILSTGNARDITNASGEQNQATNTTTDTAGIDGDPLFDGLAGGSTFDASILVVDFIPDGDTLSMQFVFASDEYPEYADSIYNDIVGVWINGDYVPLVVGDTSVGGINDTDNQNLYVDNTADQYNTEMDGFTVTMTLSIPVVEGVENQIIIGVADVADAAYDSSLLIAGGSVQTTFDAGDDALQMGTNGATRTLDVLANDDASGGALTVTHINGQPVSVGDTVTLPTGQTVALNADGTFSITGDADPESYSFTYTAQNTSGQTDTAFVIVDQVPCFAAGTMIRTPGGEVPVESLRPGDLVETVDDGPQPVRWAGSRTVAATGDMAPIRISGGTFGAHETLEVSPQHRVLIRSGDAELMFGSEEVLVKAKDLVLREGVSRREGGEVTYWHLLFDRHQVIWSEGLPTESFLPGPQTVPVLAQKGIAAEIRKIFPDLDLATGKGYGPPARPVLRGYESALVAG